MMPNIDISEQLREQRKEYVKLRERAARISTQYPNSDLGAVMAEQCNILDVAIANIDVALNLSGGVA